MKLAQIISERSTSHTTKDSEDTYTTITVRTVTIDTKSVVEVSTTSDILDIHKVKIDSRYIFIK